MKSLFEHLARSSSPFFSRSVAAPSPTSVVSADYVLLLKRDPLYVLGSQEERVAIGWAISHQDNIFELPHGLYDFVVVATGNSCEIRMLPSDEKVEQHASMLHPQEEPFYAGQVEFHIGSMKRWNAQHSLVDLDCVEHSDIPFPQDLFSPKAKSFAR